MGRKRFLQIDSTQLSEDTAELSDSQFRAFILIQAWGNECMYHENDFKVTIAKNRLPSVAPNRRHSVATSARVVRELCATMTWGVREGSATWVISAKKDEQNQGSDPPNKKKNKKKKREQDKPPPAECVTLAKFLNKEIQRIQPERNLPAENNPWAWIYEKAMRIDGRRFDSLLAQINWLFSPENQSAEARFEVFSAASHRKKYDAIERMRERASRPATRRPGKMERMAAILEEQENAQSTKHEGSRPRLVSGEGREETGAFSFARDVSGGRGRPDRG